MIKSLELSQPLSCFNRADDEELIFVLLGRDIAAPNAIRTWVEQRLRLGKNKRNDHQILEALDCANRMEDKAAPAVVPIVNLSIPWTCKECRSFGSVSVPMGANLSDVLTLIANSHGVGNCSEQLSFSITLDVSKEN